MRAWPHGVAPCRNGALWRALALSAATTALIGCTTFPRLEVASVRAPQGAASAQAQADRRLGAQTSIIQRTRPEAPVEGEPPPPPRLAPATAEEIATLIPDRRISATLPPQPLPQFIDTVFGQILRVPYFTGPGVSDRRDFVALRGPDAMSSHAFFATVQTALEQYGLAVQIDGGAVRIVEDPALVGRAPLFVRARALPETPEPARPVIQLFELNALDVGTLMGLLQETYPRRGSVVFTPREDINALVISGNAREVSAAAAIVNQLDQPRYANGNIARISPLYWEADRLADAIASAMRTEGYRVPAQASAQSPIVFLPVPFSNDLLLFSSNEQAFDRALAWARQLDQPASVGDGEGVFVYHVQNTSAAELARALGEAAPEAIAPRAGQSMSERRSGLERSNGSATPDAAPALGGGGGRVTVDVGGNRMIFRGTASQFAQLRRLMEELDTATPQVLVELTIAEVTLTDETRFGVEWFLQQRIGSAQIGIDTRGGSAREDGGLGATYSRVFSNGSVQAALNAIATNRNLNILSTPRLMARSGGEAEILVGQDVPIITSQRASDNQTGGDTDILQSVQYRQTGVILNIRPVVYGDGRVDIEIYQEVSSQQPNETSSIDSPLILNRSVSTQLSLREGTTGVIGGLIQDSYTRTQTGVPMLKDVPVLGAAFRSDGVTGDKVELVVLVTPYVVRNEDDMAYFADAYTNPLNALMRRRGPQTYTLLPWRNPLQAPRAHGAVTRGAPAEEPAPITPPN